VPACHDSYDKLNLTVVKKIMFTVRQSTCLLYLFSAFLIAQDKAPDQKDSVSPPKLIKKTEPQYTEQATADQISGLVLLSLTVGADGVPKDISVVKGLGAGLDEKAIDAVSEWRFTPAMKNSVPVATKAQVTVNFKLCHDDCGPANAKGGISQPVLISKTEPQYTDKARRDRISGRVHLSLIVDEHGIPTNIAVISPLGDGLDQKAIEAVTRWRFKPATKNGVPVAAKAQVEVSFRLGGTSPDFDQKERARDTYNTAIHYLLGDLDFKKSEKTAFQMMQRAAALQFAPAETKLGEFYSNGIGTPVDKAKAVELFDQAAFHGDAIGEYDLGTAYLGGVGVARDPHLAWELFTRAADKDLGAAEFALGLMLETGDGAAVDLPQATKWYRKSAEQDIPVAQYHLAKLYWSGSAGKQDQVAALSWALLADKNGIKDATPMAQQYRAAMNSEQVAEAEKRVAHFKVREPKPKK
jgi:TonB family protein